MIIQIYEIQVPEEAEALCAMGVDHIGSVVLDVDAWRQPTVRETVRTVRRCGKKSSLIPLFSDPDIVFRTLDYYRPDIVHFCDMLSLDAPGMARCRRLMALQEEIRNRYPAVAIMRSIPIGRPAAFQIVPTLALAALFRPVSDFFLTDTLLSGDSGANAQPVEGFVGITGETCHWDTAQRLVSEAGRPVILAGGMAPENVAEGIRQVRPAGVDSCTRTNRLDARGRPIRFQKDMMRVRAFVEEARRAATGRSAKMETPAKGDPGEQERTQPQF